MKVPGIHVNHGSFKRLQVVTGFSPEDAAQCRGHSWVLWFNTCYFSALVSKGACWYIYLLPTSVWFAFIYPFYQLGSEVDCELAEGKKLGSRGQWARVQLEACI